MNWPAKTERTVRLGWMRQLQGSLVPSLAARGFRLKLGRDQMFVRQGTDRLDRYGLVRRFPDRRSDPHQMYVSVFVHVLIPSVLELAQRIGLDAVVATKQFPAIVGGALGLWKPYGSYESFPVDGPEEIPLLSSHLIEDFETYALPFFEKYGTPERVAAVMDEMARACPPGRARAMPDGGTRTMYLAAFLAARGVEGAMAFVRSWPRVFRRIDEAELRQRLEAALAAAPDG